MYKKQVIALCCFLSFSVHSFITTTKPGVTYDLAANTSDGSLFLAASTAPAAASNYPYTVASLKIQQASTTTTPALALQPHAPDQVFVSADGSDKRELPRRTRIEHPLHASHIVDLAALGAVPVVAYGSDANNAHTVAVLADVTGSAQYGEAVLVNTAPINDSAGKAAKTIKKITAGILGDRGCVFAAVTPSTSASFTGQEGAGIATLIQQANGLAPAAGMASALETSMMQIAGEGTIETVSSIVWDRMFCRLYVGLTIGDTGGHAVMVGTPKITNTSITFSFAPLINVADWPTDSDYIVADKNDALSMQHLAVMHTSTGAHQLVVGRDDSDVYAIPLCLKGAANITAPSDAATLATTDQLYTTASTAARVGGGSLPGVISHLFVKGDAVIATCSDDAASNGGLYVSQPLFSTSGAVTGWSAWQRMATCDGPVYACGVDSLARTYMLTGTGDDARSVCAATTWTENSDALAKAVHASLPSETGGIQTISFFQGENDARATWHSAVVGLDESTLLVAGGNNACVLALTGVGSTPLTQAELASADMYGAYQLADHGVDVGFIQSTLATSVAGEGYLFVGGTKGCAVLSNDSGGGWVDLAAIATLRTDGFTFKAIGDFGEVRTLKASGDFLYVVTDKALYRVTMDAAAFAADADPLVVEEIATPELVCGNQHASFLDFECIGEHAVLATTAGLWTMNDTTLALVADGRGDGGWKELTFGSDRSTSFGVCAHISFIPSADATSGGLLHVLSADVALNIATLYRVAITSNDLVADAATNGVVTHTLGQSRDYATLLGMLREYFYSDGAYAFDVGSLHASNMINGIMTPIPVRILPVTTEYGWLDRWRSSVVPSFENQAEMKMITGIMRDPASGGLCVTGAFGLAVLR